MGCPCKECEKVGCGSFHDECDKYVAWRAEREEISKKRLESHAHISRSRELKYRRKLKEGKR